MSVKKIAVILFIYFVGPLGYSAKFDAACRTPTKRKISA